MPDYIRDATYNLWDDKVDRYPRASVLKEWGKTEADLVKDALQDIRSYVRAGLFDVGPVTISNGTLTTATIGTAAITTATITGATITGATIGDINLVADQSPSVGPELDWIGNRAGWFIGVDVANAPTSRDFVHLGIRGTYSFPDGATTNASPTLTSPAHGGFVTALIGASISGAGIQPGTTVAAVGGPTSLTMSAGATATASGVAVTITRNTVQDVMYWKHRGALSPTCGIGVTPPDGSARLQVSPQDDEVAMGTMRLRVGPSQTGKALAVHDSTPTDQWWVTNDFYMSGVSGTGVKIQAEASASGRVVTLADNTKATQYSLDLPTGSGGVLRLRYVTGGTTIMDFGTDGSIRHLSTKIGFFSATPVTKPTISGSRGGNAALADLLTKLALLGIVTDSSTA